MMAPSMEPSRTLSPVHWLAAALVALAAAGAVHAPTFGAYVFADDVQWMTGARVFRPGQVLELGWRNHFFRPVVEVYFAVVARVLGEGPFGFHALNVLLHALNALLVVRLGLEWGGGRATALLGGLVFVVHARAVESVAW